VIASFLNWGKIFYFSVFFYTFCANAFFLVRPEPSFAQPVHPLTFQFLVAPIAKIRSLARLVQFVVRCDDISFEQVKARAIPVRHRDGAIPVYGAVGEGVEEAEVVGCDFSVAR
jgi:hypothetical protein